MHVLITGFGPFPGAPINPTGRLAQALARSRQLACAGVSRSAHVFPTSYAAVDRELPGLIARTHPDVILMFGLAARSRHVRIETRSRNAISRAIADAAGRTPRLALIAPGAAPSLALRAPFGRLVRAARSTGIIAAPSRDAGRYLCNYLCWRATEAAARPGGPKLAAFVHVPRLRLRDGPRAAPLAFAAVLRAAEAMVRATVIAARTAR